MLIDILRLRDHEEVDLFHFEGLMEELIEDGFQRDPIIVDKESDVVLDGHRRTNILKTLGYSKIASHQVQYMKDNTIRVKTWYPIVVESKKD
jgi:ParB-like chromosome segregation protein Spo0J